MKEKGLLIIGMLLISCILTGCRQRNDEIQNQIYEQEFVSMPEEAVQILDVCTMEDGSLRIAGANEAGVFQGVWEKSTITEPWEIVTDFDEVCLNNKTYEIALSPFGGAIVKVMKDESTISTFYIDNGEIAELEEQLPENLYWSEYGSLFGYEGIGKITLIEPTTGEIQQEYNMDQKVIGYIFADKENLYVYSENEMLTFDLSSGKLVSNSDVIQNVEKCELEQEEIYRTSGAVMAGDENNMIYLANRGGIFCVNDGNSKQIMDAQTACLSGSSWYIDKICANETGDIFLLLRNENETLLERIIKDGEHIEKTILTIYTLENNEALEDAIQRYKTENNNVEIEVVVGMTGEEGVTIADAVRTLNTEVLAGKGTDLILLDGLDAQRYWEQGVLMDMSEIVETVNEQEGLYMNLLKEYEHDGMYYAIPTSFVIPVLLGEADVVANAYTMEKLVDSAIQNKDEDMPLYCGYSYEHMVQILYRNYCEPMLKANQNRKDSLEEFYSVVEVLYQYNEQQEETKDRMISSCSLVPGDYADAVEVANSEAEFGIDYVVMPISYQMLLAAENMCSYEVEGLEVEGQKSFVPVNTIGINVNSENQDEAKKFVTYLISRKEQENSRYSGLPINKIALDEILETTEEEQYEDIQLRVLTQEDRERLKTAVSELETALETDQVLYQIVMEQADNIKQGKISVQEATENAEEKIVRYKEE